MGCSSTKSTTSTPQSKVADGPANDKSSSSTIEATDEPTCSPEAAEEFELTFVEGDEGQDTAALLANPAHRFSCTAGRGSPAGNGERSEGIPAEPSPAESQPLGAVASTDLSVVTESQATRSTQNLRTASLPKVMIPSPFNSVPREELAKSDLFWKDLHAKEFSVRAAGYGKAHKNKEPSEPALYDCVGMDVLKGAKGLANLFRHRRTKDFTWWKNDSEGDWDAAWGVPRLLIVNCLLPIHSPLGFSKKPPGCALVAYFRLSPQARNDLAAGNVIPQMKLWQQNVKNGVSTRDGICFKAIGQLPQRSLAELPQILQTYNGKPVLVTESATFVKDMLPEILEIDVDISKWAFLARQTLYSYQGVLAKHAFHMGYLVEGRTDEELPESMLACCEISGADLAAAMEID